MSVPGGEFNLHHFHIHDDDGDCYGDTRSLNDAAETVAALNLDQEDILFFVVDAPCCINVCRES